MYDNSLCTKRTLSNGMHILLIPSKQAPVVAIQGWIKFGAADETDDIAGLAHLFEHLLFKGTSKRRVGQIAAEIEGMGGDLNAFTSYDQTVMHMTLASKYLEEGLEILSDALKNSVVEEEELTRERVVVLEEIKRRNDMPGARAGDLFRELLFAGHPYSRPVIGYESVVAQMSRESILSNYKKYYNSQNIFLVLSGDLEEGRAIELCEKYFSDIGRGTVPASRTQISAPLRTREKVLHHASPHSLLHLGWLGPDGLDRDVAALDALSFIMGQGESSRMFRSLVLEQNLLRDISMGSWTPKDKGTIDIFLKGDPKIEKDFPRILREIRKCFDAPVAESEIEKAKKNLLSSALYSQETVDGLANRFGFFECSGDYTEDHKYMDHVRSLDCAKIEEVKHKYILWERVALGGIVPNGEKIPKLAFENPKLKKVPSTRRGGSEIIQLKRNGLKVIIKPLRHLPLFSLRWVGLGGSRLESPAQAGIGNLWSRTVTNGGVGIDGKRWTQPKLLEELDQCAASLSAVHGRNSWGYYIDGMKEDLPRLLELLSATKDGPDFEGVLVKDDIRRQLVDIKAADDQPAQVAFRMFGESLFGKNSAYGRSTLGDARHVKALNPAALRKYHQKLLGQPQVLSIVGNVEVDDVMQRLEDYFPTKKIPERSALLKFTDVPKTLAAGRHSRKLPKEQTHIVLGYPTCHLKSADKWALQGMAAILSGQSGRLFIELRDKKSLCYTVSPSHMEAFMGGYFGFYIATSPEKVGEAISSLEAEITRFVEDGFEANEWERSKAFYLGHYLIEQQKFSSQASGMALDELYGLGCEEYFKFPEHFERITLGDINRVAKKYFSTAQAKKKIITVVGPKV